MATQIVYVSLQGQGDSTNLRLRDTDGNDGVNDITTKVNPTDRVQWQVDTTPPNGATQIYSIEKVYKKPDRNPLNINLLTTEPINIGNGVWQATVITPSPGKDKIEFYNIDFKRTSTDSTHTDDPKLQMNV
jgi:hypothetical protein